MDSYGGVLKEIDIPKIGPTAAIICIVVDLSA